MAFGVAVGGQERRFDGLDDNVDRDALVGLDGVQRRHVDVHAQVLPRLPGQLEFPRIGGENCNLDNGFGDTVQG